jgi:hypothetical protein
VREGGGRRAADAAAQRGGPSGNRWEVFLAVGCCLDVGYRPESYDVTCKSNVTEYELLGRRIQTRKLRRDLQE